MQERIESINNSKLKIAVKIGRYKRKGYEVAAVGYPVLFYECFDLLQLCDYFIDNDMDIRHNTWKTRFQIKKVEEIDTDKFIVVVFSYNRYNTLLDLMQQFDDLVVIEIYFSKGELLRNTEEIENSSLLKLETEYKSTLSVSNPVQVHGQSLIRNVGRGDLRLSAVELNQGSVIENGSGSTQILDSIVLEDYSMLRIKRKGKAEIFNSYISSLSEINVYSGSLKLDNAYIGRNCVMHVYKNINVGYGTIISWGVSLLDGDGHSLIVNGKENTPKEIIIGNNVWIGNNAIILKGVSIGDGSVVGAGSVVTQSIPARSIAVGNPARIISSDIEWKYKYNY